MHDFEDISGWYHIQTRQSQAKSFYLPHDYSNSQKSNEKTADMVETITVIPSDNIDCKSNLKGKFKELFQIQ
jgi:hypothetical protein